MYRKAIIRRSISIFVISFLISAGPFFFEDPISSVVSDIILLFFLSAMIGILGSLISIIFFTPDIPARIDKKIKDKVWFSRWYEPKEDEMYMLKDPKKYFHDKKEFEKYNQLRRFHLTNLSRLSVDYEDEIYRYYLSKYITEGNSYLSDKIRYFFNRSYFSVDSKAVKDYLDKMESEGITLKYRPEIDYMFDGGPFWADCPERSTTKMYPLEDRIYIITFINIDKVMMDKSSYYDDHLKEKAALSKVSNHPTEIDMRF